MVRFFSRSEGRVRVHHLNCGTMCPHRLLAGSEFVCHVLLVEHAAGLVLVDTGYGLGDIENPKRIGPVRHILHPQFDPAETAVHQVEALGFDRSDVRHIALTHLDIDHAGGLGDFPDATVHLMEAEHAAATNPPSFADKNRYFPIQWAHGPKWNLLAADGDEWEGLSAVRPLPELGDDIALVPLPGHTRGHAAVAVNAGDRWLLHAGDAYFHRNEVPSDGSAPKPAPRGIRAFERMAAVENDKRLQNLEVLQNFAQGRHERVRVFPAHDPIEFERVRNASAAQ